MTPCDAALRRRAPNVWAFKKEHLDAGVPLVITHAVDDWPAMSKWPDLEYSKRHDPHVIPEHAVRQHSDASNIAMSRRRSDGPLPRSPLRHPMLPLTPGNVHGGMSTPCCR